MFKPEETMTRNEPVMKRLKTTVAPSSEIGRDLFEALPDDVVLSILGKLSSSADCPADFITVLITCKRLNALGLSTSVLSKASLAMLAVKAKKWSESGHSFLKLCADSGNVEACFILGMIQFYCLGNRLGGTFLMAKAAYASHAPALYSLAVIHFNGSGASKTEKKLRAGVALCSRAAFLGHVDALRELGHCVLDGYGVERNVAQGRLLIIKANARELVAVLASLPDDQSNVTIPKTWLKRTQHHRQVRLSGGTSPLISDFGCNLPPREPHPAHRFLSDWFDGTGRLVGAGLRLCSHSGCGRPETRRNEFRRCSVCGAANYCSRACQALDWKAKHKLDCSPPPPVLWVNAAVDGNR